MNPVDNIATDLFYKIRSRFSGLKLGTSEGAITINPEQARFFDFDYMDGEVAVGHVTVSLAEENSMKVYFSNGITESMEDTQKQKWYGFLKELRQFAKRRLMAFDTRDIAKDNLDKRDFAFLSQYNKPQPQTNQQILKPVGESIMSESTMYGTKTVSYQRLLDTRLIIKHSHALIDDQQPGARTRNISALFVENQEGERFKYPFIHLAGARAMQRHVANGGVPYDNIGKSIINMSEEIAQLKSFSNYVVRNDLMNSDTNDLVSKSQGRLNDLREQIAKLAKQRHYESYVANYQDKAPLEVPQSVVEQYKDQFTVKSFRENIASVFPILYRLQQENSLGYGDIVAETEINDEADIIADDVGYENDFDNYESWILGLGESSPLQSSEEQLQAIDNLNTLITQTFPAGVDGTNAIESLKGIIEDPNLFKEIKDIAKLNPQEDIRPLIKAWVDENAATIADQLDFGDMEQAGEEQPAEEPAAGEEQPAEEPEAAAGEEQGEEDAGAGDAAAAGDAAVAAATGEEEVVTQGDDNETRGERRRLNVRELAEFIQSFYDRESGTFPKGPEGVCTMVGKKFGEQAEKVARKFVERLAPQQTTENNPELQELARIKGLAGLQAGESVSEASGGYVWDEVGDEKDQAQLNKMANDIVTFYQHNHAEEASKDEILATLDEIVRKYMPQVGTMNNVAPVSQEFFDKFPLKKSEPEYDDEGEEIDDEEYESNRDQFHSYIWNLVKISAAAEKGDTSSYGYRMHSENEELARIRELAGMRSESGGYHPNQHPQSKDYGTGDGKNTLQVFNVTGLEDSKGTGTAVMYDEEENETEVNIKFDIDHYDREINVKIWEITDEQGREIDLDSVDFNEDDLVEKIYKFHRDQNESAVYEDGDVEELKTSLRQQYQEMYDSAMQGMDQTDHIVDDLGEYFNDVRRSKDKNIKKGYQMVRDAADTDPEEQAEALRKAMRLLDPPEPDVEIDRESTELEDIRRLSGIAQGVGF